MELNDDDLIAQLEACTLPENQFHHADHLRAAWIYLTRYAPGVAMEKFSATLIAYATRLGQPGRYHATITWAYLLLLNERIYRSSKPSTWNRFAAEHPDLFDWNNSILLRYYLPETLSSPLARRVFLMPDVPPVPLSVLADPQDGLSTVS